MSDAAERDALVAEARAITRLANQASFVAWVAAIAGPTVLAVVRTAAARAAEAGAEGEPRAVELFGVVVPVPAAGAVALSAVFVADWLIAESAGRLKSALGRLRRIDPGVADAVALRPCVLTTVDVERFFWAYLPGLIAAGSLFDRTPPLARVAAIAVLLVAPSVAFYRSPRRHDLGRDDD